MKIKLLGTFRTKQRWSTPKIKHTRRSQHSQECKDPRRRCIFVTCDFDLWSFDSKINGLPGLIVKRLRIRFGDRRLSSGVATSTGVGKRGQLLPPTVSKADREIVANSLRKCSGCRWRWGVHTLLDDPVAKPVCYLCSFFPTPPLTPGDATGYEISCGQTDRQTAVKHSTPAPRRKSACVIN